MKKIIDTGTEVIEIDPETGEITTGGTEEDFKAIQQMKIKAVNLLKPSDFVLMGETWEAKRDGLIKILSSLPVGYEWRLLEKHIEPGSYATIEGKLIVKTGEIERIAAGLGTCEASEFTGRMKYSLHNMTAKAETRALKRAIETLFGSVINYYVLQVMMKRAA